MKSRILYVVESRNSYWEKNEEIYSFDITFVNKSRFDIMCKSVNFIFKCLSHCVKSTELDGFNTEKIDVFADKLIVINTLNSKIVKNEG